MTREETERLKRHLAFARRQGVTVITTPMLVRRISPWKDLKGFLAILRHLLRLKPDIIHTHTSKAGLLGRLAAWLARVPVVVHTPHGHVFYGHFGPTLSRFFLLVERILSRITNHLVALTPGEAEDYMDLGVMPPHKISVIPSGIDLRKPARFDCTPLTVCGLAALLQNCTEQDVNMVNAMLVAEEMGIVVEGVRSTETESFSNLITLTLETPTGTRMVAGTLFEGTPKIVKMRNFTTDFQPEEHMLVITYTDRPGLIGKIGTILGEEGLNIGNMNLGRQERAGEAMVVLSTDTPIGQRVIVRLTEAVEPLFIKAVHLSGA